MLTLEMKNRIYDALVIHAQAREGYREMFLCSFPECREFRFMGALGFGGKSGLAGPRGVRWYTSTAIPMR